MARSTKLFKASLWVNAALAAALVGVLVWSLIPKPKAAVSNVSVSIYWQDSAIHIDAKNYSSNIVKDILSENKTSLKLEQSELDSGYITKINNVSGDWLNGFWWLLTINDVPSEDGISTSLVKSGVKIAFRLVPTSYNPWG